MKLGKIEHYRCSELDRATYVWLADDVTEDELQDIVRAAQNAYDQARTDFSNDPTAPKDPGGWPQYERFPNKTVGEVKMEYDKARAIFLAWKKKQQNTQKPFSHFLVKGGKGRVKGFYDVDEDDGVLTVAAADWGHRHGQKLNYGPTDQPWERDLNAKPSEDDDYE